jgi:beta-phosphoglucomutase
VPARALLFDFNGTLSDDEAIMYEVFAELFSAEGRPISQRQYLDEIAGLSDEAMVRAWLGDRPDVAQLVARRVEGYTARVRGGGTVGHPVREAVRRAAARVPVGVVSGAARVEIEPVLRAAGLHALVSPVVSSDDVEHGKPHPEGYLRALALLRLRVPGLSAGEVTVLEDTEAGIASAKAAGMRCLALSTTLPRDRLAGADGIVDAIDPELVERLLR